MKTVMMLENVLASVALMGPSVTHVPTIFLDFHAAMVFISFQFFQKIISFSLYYLLYVFFRVQL
jgi:hypothetical protein